MTDDECPVCGGTYSRRVSLSSRHGKSVDVSDAATICQDAERRSGAPTPKKTRSDSERYRFVGYIHA